MLTSNIVVGLFASGWLVILVIFLVWGKREVDRRHTSLRHLNDSVLRTITTVQADMQRHLAEQALRRDFQVDASSISVLRTMEQPAWSTVEVVVPNHLKQRWPEINCLAPAQLPLSIRRHEGYCDECRAFHEGNHCPWDVVRSADQRAREEMRWASGGTYQGRPCYESPDHEAWEHLAVLRAEVGA